MKTQTAVMFGGSFNPPHLGHAMLVSWLIWSGAADMVIIVPTFEHPFGKKLAPFDFRVKALKNLTIPQMHQVVVSEIERSIPEPSYTCNTLDALSRRLAKDWRLRFVGGADLLEQFDKWYGWDHIRDNYDPIIIGREGYQSPDGYPTMPSFSSTEIRQKILDGESYRHLVPSGVFNLLPGPYGDVL